VRYRGVPTSRSESVPCAPPTPLDRRAATATVGKSHAQHTASAGTADQKYTEWELKFRSCLSGKGFELPKEAGKIDFGDRQDAYEVARDACLRKIGKPPAASGDQPAMSGARDSTDG
jgi:hypothetical protein